MARNDYGDDLLTDAQRIQESYRIAPGGGIDVGNRLRRDVVLTASANALENPLLTPRASMGRETAAIASQAPVSAVPNPMVRSQIQPPVPRNMMGVEQQIAWQQLEDEQREKQDVAESRKLEAEIRRQQLDHRAEQVRQNQELAAHMPKLREALNTSPEAYLDLKADLAGRYAIGMGSPESDKIFSEFEKIYAKREDTEAGIKKARIAREEANRLKREDILLKQAWEQGPEVAREVAARMADPLKGVDDASALLAQVQEKSTTRALLDAGLSKEVVAQRYGGEGTGQPFDYQAARVAPKSRAFLTAERNKIGNEVMALEKMRTEAELMGNWSEENQQILDEKRAYWRSLTPEIGGRAGVQGISPGAMQVARQQAFNYATTPAQLAQFAATAAKPSPTGQPAESAQAGPGWREKARTTPLPGSRAIGTALQSAYVQPTKLAAQVLAPLFGRPAQPTQPVATRPLATPAPPPINPAYPEQWRGGKRYVQVNGQWYLSKVQ